MEKSGFEKAIHEEAVKKYLCDLENLALAFKKYNFEDLKFNMDKRTRSLLVKGVLQSAKAYKTIEKVADKIFNGESVSAAEDVTEAVNTEESNDKNDKEMSNENEQE
ncbi:hypothetical protein GCM10022297_01340 [Lactobacillus hamsteri]|uniref:Uncharacterized protein n=1 Tax=Lactobacillus hamsteri DSM 5661 = JCM 6256 TaxID=1423754 RepID=A0A0R1YDU3_9LACO|nr:hypothetical protein [Lactobacillus hamsteri]KRM37020.1 hypothetical protein FC39_GL000472 [Lactobacillus hamsteri DSM 5661 = JCM 6256]